MIQNEWDSLPGTPTQEQVAAEIHAFTEDAKRVLTRGKDGTTMNGLDLRCTLREHTAAATYKLTAMCPNCGWDGVATLSLHHRHEFDEECPSCGVSGLQFGHDPQYASGDA